MCLFISLYLSSLFLFLLFLYYVSSNYLVRGRSASIGAGTLLVKKLKDTNNKDKRTDKSPESR